MGLSGCCSWKLNAQREAIVASWLSFVASIFFIAKSANCNRDYATIVGVMTLIASMLVLIGAVMRNHLLMLPWLCTFPVKVIVSLLLRFIGPEYVIVFVVIAACVLWTTVLLCYIQKEKELCQHLNKGSPKHELQNLRAASAPELV